LIGDESQILASLMESLPTKLQLKIKIKVAQRFHHGELNPWQYDVDAQTLFEELANLYDLYNMHQQIAIILLYRYWFGQHSCDANLWHDVPLSSSKWRGTHGVGESNGYGPIQGLDRWHTLEKISGQ